MSTFSASGLVTLTTDFGHRGPFVATMKGVMLSRFSQAQILDLTHETDAHFPAEAGFWLQHSFRYFPTGSVHVAVVDPGVGTSRDILAAVVDGHAFLAPDNGLLANIVDPSLKDVVCVSDASFKRFGLKTISATFHGRDIFAPLAAEIAAGRVRPQDLGDAVDQIVPAWVDEAEPDGKQIRGIVVTQDSFGNLITNIGGDQVAKIANPVAVAGGRTFELKRTYGDVQPGDYLALINSLGVLEIARAESSAAETLSIGRGAPVVVRPKP